MFLRFINLVLVASLATAAGCVVPANDEGDSSALTASTDNALSSYGALLVGDYRSVDGALYPRFSLAKDGTYSFDTGIRCVKAPCPSGDSGKFTIWHDGWDRHYVRLLSIDHTSVHWYRVDSLEVVTLTGVFGTTGAFHKYVEPAAQPTCVQVVGTDGKISVKNFTADQQAQGVAWAEATAAGAGYGISVGTCDYVAANYACTKDYVPVCAFVSGTEAGVTYQNACEAKRAVIAAAGSSSEAVGMTQAGACTSDTPTCATYRVGDAKSFAYYVHDFGSAFEANAWITLASPASSQVLPGKCAASQICPMIYAPVCGGVKSETAHTYSNVCQFEAAVRLDSATDGFSKGRVTTGGACP